MMSFVNYDIVTAATPLKSGHFRFARAQVLHDALSWCVTDYYTKALSGRAFEARGVMIVAESRQGKSHEINRMIDQLNDSGTLMPDGRPARIVQVRLSGTVTWKDMGNRILSALGYPNRGRRTQAEIWDMVIKYAQVQGVIGVHFDECQHVFSKDGAATNRKILDSFKTVLKDSRWPLMLILSGIPELERHIVVEEQLYRLLRTVRFAGVDVSRPQDMDEIIQLTYSFADTAKIEIEQIATRDFFERLAFAACQRWGLVIELVIEAFVTCQVDGDAVCKVQHFSRAFSKLYATPAGYSPFDLAEYRVGFDRESLMDILSRAD